MHSEKKKNIPKATQTKKKSAMCFKRNNLFFFDTKDEQSRWKQTQDVNVLNDLNSNILHKEEILILQNHFADPYL